MDLMPFKVTLSTTGKTTSMMYADILAVIQEEIYALGHLDGSLLDVSIKQRLVKKFHVT